MQRLSRPVSAFPAVEARGIYAGYEKGVPVLDGTTVSFDPGRVVGMVGRNGAGKSTLLKCLAGIKKEELGHVRFQGSVVPPKRRPEHVFLVMQDPDYQLFRPSVRDELASAAPSPSDVDELRLEAVLRGLAMGDVADRHPASLSGGQKQRCVCAIASSRARRRFSSTSPRAVWISGTWNASRSSYARRRLAGRRWRSSATTRSSCQRPATRLCSSVSRPAKAEGIPTEERIWKWQQK